MLHTWSQTLRDHYHLHCIVSGGGPARDGRRWVHWRPDYLFHVGALIYAGTSPAKALAAIEHQEAAKSQPKKRPSDQGQESVHRRFLDS